MAVSVFDRNLRFELATGAEVWVSGEGAPVTPGDLASRRRHAGDLPRVMVADDHRRFRERWQRCSSSTGSRSSARPPRRRGGARQAAAARRGGDGPVHAGPERLGRDRLVRDAPPSTPVVVLTAFIGDELERAALAAGATAYVAKDANLEAL